MPLSLGEQIPVVKRRAGRPPQDCHLWRKKTKDEEELARLELEYEIQTKIVSAAHKLLSDSSLKKNIRRQRKLSHQKAVAKLKEIEQKLAHFRKKEFLSSENVYRSNTEKMIQSASANLKDLSITFSPSENEKEGAKNTFNKMTSSTSSPVPLSSSSVPSSPSNPRHLPLKPPPDLLQGYTPSSVYQTQTTYRSQQYPTFSMRSPSTHSSTGSECGGPLIAPYRNKFESTLDLDGSNLYSVPTQRTSQAFDTQDDILATVPMLPQDLGLVSRHNSLDRNRRHSFQKYRRYLENQGMFQDPSPQRPGSAQPNAAYDNYAMYKGMFPYQEQQQQSYVSAYSFHHPHHYHHHRHQGVKSPNPQECPDSNLYQKNLKLYAADAMHLGKQFRKSPTSPPEKLWPEAKTPKGSYAPALLSPSSESERSWTMEGTSSEARVPTSVSADGLKSHVDIVTYGHFQPYWEETKPYETSDFYKYSTKHRKQHQTASQNLQAKLLAWKASQSAGVPAAMSPVLERSRTSSPACAAAVDEGVPSEKLKQEGSSDQPSGDSKVTSDAFHDDILDWFNKQEKGKKTTLV